VEPAGPAPITTTSRTRDLSPPSSDLVPAILPAAAERNPERQHHQPHVEPERPAPDVEAIVPELLPPRQVPPRIDLGQARQAGRHRGTFGVARNILERHRPTVAFDLD